LLAAVVGVVGRSFAASPSARDLASLPARGDGRHSQIRIAGAASDNATTQQDLPRHQRNWRARSDASVIPDAGGAFHGWSDLGAIHRAGLHAELPGRPPHDRTVRPVSLKVQPGSFA
jgi:hypothetical protein